ncbi:unnamed protein product [Ectocarpus sp. CCAP 1310/34]|nr:unnamed protein product [Ectocarpus sp. CCAP 1310/34]
MLPPRPPTFHAASPAKRRPVPVGFRRSSSSVNSSSRGQEEQKRELSPRRSKRLVRPQSARFHSSHDVLDTSHLDGLYFEHQRAQALLRLRQEGRRQERKLPVYPSKSAAVKVGIVDDCDDDEDSPTAKCPASADDKFTTSELDDTRRYGEYSAEEIALRRFMTMVAWGSGLNVVKYNRGRGRVRRVLKFNDEEGFLCWCGTLPPYAFHKTKVPAQKLLKASRLGNLVTVGIADEGDVAFRCGRLTEAIVLEVGLNGVIRACNNTSKK